MCYLWRFGVKVLLWIIEVVEVNYFEILGCFFILWVFRVFFVFWMLVSLFIDDNIRRKFFIYVGNDYQGFGGLLDYIDKEIILDFLSGECMCEVLEGLVFKFFYWIVEELENEDLKFWIEIIYQFVSVFKGVLYEIFIQIVDVLLVIIWDFDVCKGDIVFNIYYFKRLL